MKPIHIVPTRPSLGMDPEIFFEEDGKIIPSELIIPKEGIGSGSRYDTTKVIRDGVQAEINIPAGGCRQSGAVYTSQAFAKIKNYLAANHPKVTVSTKTMIILPKKDHLALSEDSRALGCKPSFNCYRKAISDLGIDPGTYRGRSAGGHLHFGGIKSYEHVYKVDALQPILEDRLPRMMDLMLGIPSILIEKDKKAAARRKVYGRAGEFRLPSYGVEYRTLSNHWLRSMPLQSFYWGMGRMAISTCLAIKDDETIYGSITSQEIEKAINLADVPLAEKIWERFKPTLRRISYTPSEYPTYLPLQGDGVLDDFDFFVSKPIDFWFPHDPLTYWTNGAISGTYGSTPEVGGWESFLSRVVRPARIAAKKG